MVEVKEALQDRPVLVALAGNRLGSEIKKPGASFALSNIYGEKDAMVGSDRVTQVYVRTEDGNIYRLDDRGNLIDAKESQKRGSHVQASLKTEQLERQKLTVGESFFYGFSDKSGRTSRVTEIVPVVAHRVYVPEVLREITRGITNTIKEDFQKMLPPQRTGERKENLLGSVGLEDLEKLRGTRAANPLEAKGKRQVTPAPEVSVEKEPTKPKPMAPKGNFEQTHQETQNIEDKELEQKAAELAKETRKRGMGCLYGKFPPTLAPTNTYNVAGYGSIEHFVQGQEMPFFDPAALMFIDSRYLSSLYKYDEIYRILRNGRQLWISSNYNPPTEVIKEKQTIEREEKKFFGLKKQTFRDTKIVRTPTNIPISYHGMKGEDDWIMYEYSMLVDHFHDSVTRGDPVVTMHVFTPPDLAKQIDEQVEKNVYFPDVYFKALYPNHIGADRQQYIKRVPSAGLEVVDTRTEPYKKEVRSYPQPIPY